ncbi:FAD-dependent oxidoreductase [Rhizobium leguminosarum bv. trifolii]|uniref:FAD-dependent oxidoreductase n=1 Tax=Rhizobium leguminosarum bv. trifolii TaxID=386 RepID=A0A3E1AZN4_RHILT|nr:FAD-binding oxidoreductase [Rhizobium leguminosarum]RFB83133.1 FAD-dependent oxidoreductase [Rhizobium leguminosarum bv. trifolii]RFB83509.1 FAD-dependent oxidoreductase [Rhizobium leguminosarum bv. trifolii]
MPRPYDEPTVSGWYLTSGADLPLTPQGGETSCECLVIGAGWMGLHAARRYAELRPDASVVLVDAGRIGNNASGRCMGFAIDLAHNPRKQDFVEDIQGNREELEVNLDGNAYLRSAVEEHGVDCDWDPQGKYHSAATEHGVAALVSFSHALDKMGQRYSWVEKDEIQALTGSKHYIRALHHPGTILLQPAKYLKNAARALPKNVTVHENTAIIGAQYGNPLHVFQTPTGVIKAKKVIICAAGYLTEFGFYPNSAIPLYTFASMTRELTPSELAKVGTKGAYGLIPANSFGTTVRRTTDNRLLLRNVYSYANDFKTTLEDVEAAKTQQQLAFDRRWPELSPMGFAASWGGLLTLAQNGGMVFGQLAENVYGAAFCNGTGVSRGTSFGKSVAELAAGRSSPIIEILKRRVPPSRAYPKLITATGVRFVTGWRFKQAGKEV